MQRWQSLEGKEPVNGRVVCRTRSINSTTSFRLLNSTQLNMSLSFDRGGISSPLLFRFLPTRSAETLDIIQPTALVVDVIPLEGKSSTPFSSPAPSNSCPFTSTPPNRFNNWQWNGNDAKIFHLAGQQGMERRIWKSINVILSIDWRTKRNAKGGWLRSPRVIYHYLVEKQSGISFITF